MELTSGRILLALLIALPFAFLVSMSLLSLYRRAVLRSMRTRASSGPIMDSLPVDDSASMREPPLPPVRIVVLDKDTPRESSHSAEYRVADLLSAPWRAAAIHALAGLCCAIALTTTFLLAANLEFLPFRFVSFLWLYAWPIVFTTNLVAGTTSQQRLLHLAAYFLVLAGLEIIAVIRLPDGMFGQLTFLWVILNLPASLLFQFFLSRRVRAVGPLVLLIMILAVTGSYMALLIATGDVQMLEATVKLGLSVGLTGDLIFIAILLLGFIPLIVCGWLIIQWVGFRYKRKKISDQSITLDAIWLFYTIFVSVDFMSAGVSWVLAGPLAFIVYKIVVVAGFSLFGHKISVAKKSNALLLLRVFSLGKRSERLFESISTHWRYVGDIRFIAGPDLATTTVEPHEFLEFIGGKLARRFIDNAQLFELRLSEMDLKPDPDGRFRVNDFFCRDDTWRMVLSRLITECDAVLMDIRGFSAQNSGCIFEINELINIVPLGRVVFVIDHTTDETFLRQVIQQSWTQMSPTSPNRLSTSESLRLFRLTGLGSTRLQRLLQTLSLAANPSTVP
jgi:hypothetical protein